MRILLLVLSLFLICPGLSFSDTLKLEIEIDRAELKPILQQAIVLPAVLNDGGALKKRWLRHYQKQLQGLVSSSLEPYGYFNSLAQSSIEQSGQEEYLLKLEVSAGEPVIISSLLIELSGEGAKLPGLGLAVESFPLKNGDILRQDVYETGKSRIIQSAVDYGLLDAKFIAHQLHVYRAENRAEILLQLDTGIRYRFGKITFSGDSGYPDEFLRRYLECREGDFFSHPKLGQTQLSLQNSDLFEQVTIVPISEQAIGDLMPVTIDLRSAPRHRLRPGIGYGTDTGARASLSYHDRNLFRSGQEMKGDLLLAEFKQSLVTTYTLPDLARRDSQTQLRIGFDREDNDSYLSREFSSQAEYQRVFNSRLLGSVFLRLTQEYSDIADEISNSQMLLPGVRLQWRKVDKLINPSSGQQLDVEIKGALTQLLSDTSLLQLTLQATQRVSLTDSCSLLVRLKGGTTWHNDPLNDLPVSLRFFAGGDRSVRGYSYQSLGPEDDSGDVVGGKHLLVANLELEKQLTSKWGGAVFYDVGNAFDNFSEYELAQGAGVGIRRYTPIGPIKLDLARQIGNSEQRWRIHLSMGFGL
jgi:translocation and assembly module TamA